MTGISNRIRKWIARMARQYQQDRNFSIFYALWRIEEEFGGRIGRTKIAGKARNKRREYILNYLSNTLVDVICSYQREAEHGTFEENPPVWTAWLDGENSAPDLVKQCLKSIRKAAGNHPVHFIDQSNLEDYLEIPDYIYEKLKSGQMKKAHFMDYVRICLLQKYGGLWLDATIFCTREFPEEIFQKSFTTCKGPVHKSDYISDYRWTTFVLGGFKENTIFNFLKGAFEKYWRDNDWDIDYLMFDYMIYLGYTKIPFIAEAIDLIPENNLQRDDLQRAMNRRDTADHFINYFQQNTYLYKLSWREKFLTTAADGSKTVYQALLDYPG